VSTVGGMRVEFTSPSERHRLCAWTAYRGKGERSVVPGSVMAAGAGLPHDVGQYVVEAATGLRRGFWGLVEQGATFKSTGRRVTKPGRALIVTHRAELDEAERIAGVHLARWRAGDAGDVARHLTAALDGWRMLDTGDTLVFRWPDATGAVGQRDRTVHRLRPVVPRQFTGNRH